jgi:arylsulfatase A-like enzyme
LLRCTLLLALWGGLVLGGLDVARILTRGDLTPVSIHYLVVALNMAQAVAGGLLFFLLLGYLPRRGLVRFAADLVQLPFPGPRAEAAGAVLVLLLAGLTGPLTGLAEERRLAGEFPPAAQDPAAGRARPADNAPNVILLVLDTVRADHLSLYGYGRPTSPNLERLAPEFLVCRNTISAAPWTVPSHASLFTGVYPYRHGARSFLPQEIRKGSWSNVFTLDQRQATLAGLLGRHGYLTAGLVSNPYLSPRSGLNRGFDQYQYQPNRNYLLPLRCQWLMKTFFGYRWRAVFDKPQQSARQLNRRIERWLDRHGDRPFFLFANYMDAHLPYSAPPPFATAFPGRLPGFRYNRTFEATIMGRKRPVMEAELEHLHAGYDGSIQYLDHELGQLLDGLRRRGLYRNSLIVLLSDHGEYFGEHALLEHSKDVYEPAMAVPLMVKFPGGEPHGEVTARTHLVDVLPTILSVLGFEVPDQAPGTDLREVTEGRTLLGENYFARVKDLRRQYGHRFRRVRQAVYQGPWKYIHSTDGNSELYDLASDPREFTNLILKRPEVAEPLRQWLEEQHSAGPAAGDPARPLEVDEETRARLEALGYI